MDLEAKLLKGSAIDVCGLKIKPLTIGEIVDDVGYEKYLELLSVLLINKNKIAHLFNNDEVKNNLRNFDLFLMDEGLVGKLIEFFKVFLKNESVSLVDGDVVIIDGEEKVIVDEEENVIDERERVFVNRDNYDEFLDVFCQMYYVRDAKEQKYKPANKKAEEFIRKLEEKNKQYAKVKKTNEKSLFDVISGVAWKAPNMNIFEIWDLTVYQLYDAYYRLEIIDEYEKIYTGIYSGAVDSKKIKLKEYDWTKKIKLNIN